MKWHYHIQFLNNQTRAIFETINEQLELDKARVSAIEQALEADNRNEFIIAVKDNDENPVGLLFITADTPADKVWTIDSFALVPEVQKQGLGRLLNQTIAEWAADSGANVLQIKLAKTETEAAAFLTHIGYQVKADAEIVTFQLTV